MVGIDEAFLDLRDTGRRGDVLQKIYFWGMRNLA